MAVPDSSAFLCYACKHEFTPAQSMAPLRIFLSYGHDANEELVRRIKADLEKREHDVWFDKNEIKFGDDWRRAITDGITGSNRVLSFLSKHSTRDPGVCLDEIAIAIGVKGGNIQTILVESETEVKPPASISHIQWLDMHDWKERQESGWRILRQSVFGASCSESSPHQAPAKPAAPLPPVQHGVSAGPPEQPDSWETWYQAKLAEIIRVVESDESRRFVGEIETLSGHLKPIASDSRISTLLRKGFIGRKWLFDAIENWRNPGSADPQIGPSEIIPDPQSPLSPEFIPHNSSFNLSSSPSRLFWITGDPGVGKSAFAAHLTHFGRDKVIAAQFVEWDKPDHRDARRVVRSLAFQLATRLPDYRKLLLTLPEIAELDRKDPAELFDYLLANPLKTVIGGGRERLLIVIDALDEACGASATGGARATGDAGRNPLVEMLARHAPRLPDWLGLVVTSRPESAVQTPLQGLNPFVLDTRTEANRADLRDYLHHQLAPQLQPCPNADRLISQILDKSEGVFLYAERFCDDIQLGHLSLDHADQFPQGLGGIFCQWFKRQFPDLEKFRKDIRPALRAILAAREPLPVEILQRLFHWQDEELRDFTRTLGSLFPVTKEANGEVIKPYHKSLADWLADDAKAGAYFVSAKEGHRLLGDFCSAHWKGDHPFAISEVIYHLQFDTNAHAMCGVFLAPAYYERKFLKCGFDKLITDLKILNNRRLGVSARVPIDECLPEVRAIFSIAALILFNREVSATASVLRRFIEDGCNFKLLSMEREKLKPEISKAELEPRTRRAETNHYCANTAHFFDDYFEHSLKADDAALALKPSQLIDCLNTARRFYAIYLADGDPIAQINRSIQASTEENEGVLPIISEAARHLNVSISNIKTREIE